MKSERGSQSRTVDQNHGLLSDSSLLHQGSALWIVVQGTFVTLVCWQPGLLMQWCRCVRRRQSSLLEGSSSYAEPPRSQVEFSIDDVRVKDARSSRKSIGEKSLKEICSSEKVVILGAGERASCSGPVMPVRSVEQKFQNQVLIQSPRLYGNKSA